MSGSSSEGTLLQTVPEETMILKAVSADTGGAYKLVEVIDVKRFL